MWQLPALSPVEWFLVFVAAVLIGVAKSGLPGVGIISVAIFTLVLPPLEAVGSVLLLLIAADCLAVATYRRDAEWKYIAKLFPYAAAGVILGTVVMKLLAGAPYADRALRQLIGVILLALTVFQLFQRLRPKKDTAGENRPNLPPPVSALTGILAGFTTMVANAAGPVMVLYFLAMRLPKIAFVGTTAWFFAINLFKVPFGIYLGTVSLHGLAFALTIFPAALLGSFAGRYFVKRVNQQVFEGLAIIFTIIAGFRLLF